MTDLSSERIILILVQNTNQIRMALAVGMAGAAVTLGVLILIQQFSGWDSGRVQNTSEKIT